LQRQWPKVGKWSKTSLAQGMGTIAVGSLTGMASSGGFLRKKNIGTRPMLWNDAVTLAMKWPEVSEATSYGEPSLKIRKRLLARHRLDDDTIVLLDVPAEERAHLIEIMPEVFFCEPHYHGHEIVLAYLEHAPVDVIERLLERRWRNSASKRSVTNFKNRTAQ